MASQFPQWAGFPVTRVALDGWDNRTFRLVGWRLSSREVVSELIDDLPA